jgi:hypothetical protein
MNQDKGFKLSTFMILIQLCKRKKYCVRLYKFTYIYIYIYISWKNIKKSKSDTLSLKEHKELKEHK